ncbi:hypothetical protein Tco_0012451 [Tanacetum coccineum]
MSASIEAHIAEHAAAPTPPLLPPSLLSPWSSLLPQIPSPPLHVSSPPLPLPSPLTTSPTDAGAPLGYKAAACFTTLAFGLKIGESSAAGAARQPGPTLEADLRRDRVEEMGYRIIDTWDEIVEAMLEIAQTTLEGVNQSVTELATIVRQENEEDRIFHHHKAMLLDREATYARRAWTGSEDRSAAIEAHVKTLKAHVATLNA